MAVSSREPWRDEADVVQKRWARALPFVPWWWRYFLTARIVACGEGGLFGDTGSFGFESKNSVSSQRLLGIMTEFCGARSVGQSARLLSMFRQAESEQADLQRETSSRQMEMMQWMRCMLHRVKRVFP